MQDPALTYRWSVNGRKIVDHLAQVTTLTGGVAVDNTVTAIGTIDLGAFNGQLPDEGLDLKLNFAQAAQSSTGATGTCALTVKVDWSNDNFTTVLGSISSRVLTFTFASSAAAGFTLPGDAVLNPTPTLARMRVPFASARYVRVTFAYALGTITGANLGPMDVWLDEKGVVNVTEIDIG